MHELGITQEIVALAESRAGGRRVRGVVVEIGKLTAVLPDAVRFCFDLCTKGTLVEGAVLTIVETLGSARCLACGSVLQLDQPFGQCPCGCTDLDWLTGEELRITEIEIELEETS
ncbi:MAG: hydrogenase maturation nickel metallochaperone HypA [Planctomycetaceae bacterium]|nr:hydrogenase maturation nickel metallochaperone HypA [Planctomycetaceae bacterium]